MSKTALKIPCIVIQRFKLLNVKNYGYTQIKEITWLMRRWGRLTIICMKVSYLYTFFASNQFEHFNLIVPVSMNGRSSERWQKIGRLVQIIVTGASFVLPQRSKRLESSSRRLRYLSWGTIISTPVNGCKILKFLL